MQDNPDKETMTDKVQRQNKTTKKKILAKGMEVCVVCCK